MGLLILALIFLRMTGEWAEARGDKFDVVGSVIYCFAVVAMIYGFSILPMPRGP